MANNSSTGGFIAPISADILEDDDLENLFHDLFVGLTGIDKTLVRPRWLITPDNMPEIGTNWIAQGVEKTRTDTYPSEIFKEGVGVVQQRYQELDVLCTFYGDNKDKYLGYVREGISITQNRDILTANGLAFVSFGNTRNTSELINNHWVGRVDVVITFRRNIVRIYPIESLTSVEYETHAQPFSSNEIITSTTNVTT